MCYMTFSIDANPLLAGQKMKSIRRATREDASQIFNLRLTSYIRAKEFKLVEQHALAWGEHDDSDVVLVALDEFDRAISTLRGGVVPDRDDAELRMGCSVPLDTSNFPAL